MATDKRERQAEVAAIALGRETYLQSRRSQGLPDALSDEILDEAAFYVSSLGLGLLLPQEVKPAK